MKKFTFNLGLIGVGLIIGLVIPNPQSGTVEAPEMAEHVHHNSIEIDPNLAIPTLEIELEEDLKSGYNLSITLQGFELKPDKVSQEDQSPNEGHMHLLINGQKVTRLYSTFVHIPEDWLTENENTVTVTLNANDHSDWILNGTQITDTITIAR